MAKEESERQCVLPLTNEGRKEGRYLLGVFHPFIPFFLPSCLSLAGKKTGMRTGESICQGNESKERENEENEKNGVSNT